MNLDIIRAYLPLYVDALWLTLRIAALGIVLSLVVGLVCAIVQFLRVPVVSQVVAAYVAVSRSTPLLVQLFFIYFGLPKLGVNWSAETCAIVGLTFLGGSYMTEAFRSGIEAVDKIQMESALSLGMKTTTAIRYVLIPQALGVAFAGLTANAIFLVKETSVVSVVALADLMFVTKGLIGRDYNTWYALGMLVVFYALILVPMSFFASRLERRVQYGTVGDKRPV